MVEALEKLQAFQVWGSEEKGKPLLSVTWSGMSDKRYTVTELYQDEDWQKRLLDIIARREAIEAEIDARIRESADAAAFERQQREQYERLREQASQLLIPLS